MEVVEFFHYHVNITGNTFVYNRAIQRISGNSGGGVICIRNASIFAVDNTFSHNSAAGDGGVMQVDESDIIIERSIFRNSRAGGNGGVLHTYFYPTTFTIIDSSFINNQAGGDGGVIFVGRAGSHVTISQSVYGFNVANNRGGVIAIVGSTLEVSNTTIFENTAELGEVVSACHSNVTIFNLDLLASQDPTYSFCSLYNQSLTTVTSSNETIAEIDYIVATTPTSQVDIINIIPSTGSPCPGEFIGVPCFTLEQYATLPPRRQSSNTTFDLHPGIHYLNSQLSVSNIYSFTMRTNATAMTMIICRDWINNPFSFNQLQLIHISGITFIGCSMSLTWTINATFVRCSLINSTNIQVALYISDSSVLIKQCIISNNSNGAIDFSGSSSLSLTIDQSIFSKNGNYSYSGYGYHYYHAAINMNTYYYGGTSSYRNEHISILNSIFEDNDDIRFSSSGQTTNIDLLNSTFKNNDHISFDHYNGNSIISILNSTFRQNRLSFGSYININDGQNVSIVDSTFENNRASSSGHGGAIYFNGNNITAVNNFINNTASGGSGGAIYFASRRHNAIMLLMNNTFSHNSAAYCGVIKMTEFYHSFINITGNTFTYNRARD